MERRDFYFPLVLGVRVRRPVLPEPGSRAGGEKEGEDLYEAWSEGVHRQEITYERHAEQQVLEALKAEPERHAARFWIVLGEPGAGKSTLLAEWFQRWAAELGPVSLGMAVPVLVRLRDLDRADFHLDGVGLARRLWARGIEERARAGGDAHRVYRGETEGMFRPVWLLDGLDEVPAECLTPGLYGRLANLPGIKLVSCRSAVYEDLRGQASPYQEQDREYDVLGLQPDEQAAFLRKVLPDDPARAAALHDDLQRNAQLRLLAGSPLLLRMIAGVCGPGELPLTRAAFYTEAVRRMWHRKLSTLPRGAYNRLSAGLDPVLTAIAGRMGLERIEADLALLVSVAPPPELDGVPALDECLEQAGILRVDRTRGRFSFVHLTFQEFFLAKSLLPEGLPAVLGRLWTRPRYEETLALLMSLAAQEERLERVEEPVLDFVAWGAAAHASDPPALWKVGRSPLRTALHLLSRSGLKPGGSPGRLERELMAEVSVSPLRREAVARDDRVPAWVLDRLAGDPSPSVRWRVAANPATSEATRALLREDVHAGVRSSEPRKKERAVPGPVPAFWDRVPEPRTGRGDSPESDLVERARDSRVEVRWEAARNRAMPAEGLALLSADGAAGIREGVALNPSTPPEILARLAGDPVDAVRQAVALNPGAPSPTVTSLAADHAAAVRRVIAQREEVPLDTLFLLARDPDAEVRRALTLSSRTPPEVLAHLARDAEPGIRLRVGLVSATREVLDVVAADPDPGVRHAVAVNRRAPPEVLARLAADPEARVRAGVAVNSSTPAEVLGRLVHDASEEVCANVAGNSRTLPSALVRMAEDPGKMVRWRLAANPATPAEGLARLAVGADADLSRVLAANPNTPPETLARLAAHPHERVRRRAAVNPRTLLEDLGGEVEGRA